jgi:hypothetical protein
MESKISLSHEEKNQKAAPIENLGSSIFILHGLIQYFKSATLYKQHCTCSEMKYPGNNTDL